MCAYRIKSELREIAAAPPVGISACPLGESLFTWIATIWGPAGSHYDGGRFRLKIKFPEEYPLKPPNAAFIDDCFHPNVSEQGSICLDVLKEAWSPVMSVRTVLLSIQSLLGEPNPDDPFNSRAAKLYQENLPAFVQRVRDGCRENEERRKREEQHIF